MAARGLGKGLDALIPPEAVPVKKKKETTEKSGNGVEYVKLSKVEPNPKQPRRIFNEDELQELADSIQHHGMIQPILVQDRKDHYEIIAGERRWRAARLAELKEVPVIVGHYTEKQILEISLIENIQRKDINPIEEAIAYRRLMTEFKMTQDEIAESMGKSRVAITNTIRLLKLSEKVQEMIETDMISSGHARALLAIEDPELQYQTAMRAFDEKLSVRDIEKLVKELSKPPVIKPEKPELDFLYKDLEEKLKITLGTKVAIHAKDTEKGKIEIEYFSAEELERLTECLLGIKEEA